MAVNPKPFRHKEKRWLRKYRSISVAKVKMDLQGTGLRTERKRPTLSSHASPAFVSKFLALKKKKVVEVDFWMWAMWFEHKENRQVAYTKLPFGVYVSTIFLGLMGTYKSEWFETMIFGGDYDGYQFRYTSWDEAEAGHHKALEMIFGV